MGTPLQGTESAAGALGRVRYTHDAMIDLIIADPGISQGAIAKHFGYTQAWVSRVMNSDAFNARLAERKGELIDPTIVMSMEERLRTLASKSMDVVMEKLITAPSAELGLKALEISTKALGYGARQQNINMQQNFVVAVPGKAATSDEWAKAYGGQTIEHGAGQ